MAFILERNSFPTNCYGRELFCFGGKDNRDKYDETVIGDVVYPSYSFTNIRSFIEIDDKRSYYSLFHPYVVVDKKIEVSLSKISDDGNFFYIGVGKVYICDKYGKVTVSFGAYIKNLDEAINKTLSAISEAEKFYFNSPIDLKQKIKEKLKGFKRYLENFKEK